jgi:hypothetical protein
MAFDIFFAYLLTSFFGAGAVVEAVVLDLLFTDRRLWEFGRESEEEEDEEEEGREGETEEGERAGGGEDDEDEADEEEENGKTTRVVARGKEGDF